MTGNDTVTEDDISFEECEVKPEGILKLADIVGTKWLEMIIEWYNVGETSGCAHPLVTMKADSIKD